MNAQIQHRFLLSAIVCAALLSHSHIAHAQQTPNTQAAREAFAQGVAALHANRFSDALLAFEDSYSRRAAPIVLYNIGLANRGLGRYVAAIDAFDRYLAAPEPSAPADRLTAIRQELTQLRASLVTLSLEIQPENAVLSIDGRVPDSHSGAVTVDPGRHVLQITASGFANWQQELTVRSGQSLAMHVDLQPSGGAIATTHEPASSGPPATIVLFRRPQPASRPSILPNVAIVAGAVVLVGAVASAIGFFVDGNSIQNRYNSDCRSGIAPPNCASEMTTLQSSLDQHLLALDVSLGVAAVGAIVLGVGAVLHVARPSEPRRVSVEPILGLRDVAVRIRF